MRIGKLDIQDFRAFHALMLPDLLNEPTYRDHPAFDEWAQTKEKSGPAVSFFFGRRILACAGVSLLWPGVGEGWLMLSSEGAREVRAIYAVSRALVDRWIKVCNLRRLQCAVRADQPRSIRFAEWLGFQREGLMRCYGPGAVDHYMYAKVVANGQS